MVPQEHKFLLEWGPSLRKEAASDPHTCSNPKTFTGPFLHFWSATISLYQSPSETPGVLFERGCNVTFYAWCLLAGAELRRGGRTWKNTSLHDLADSPLTQSPRVSHFGNSKLFPSCLYLWENTVIFSESHSQFHDATAS